MSRLTITSTGTAVWISGVLLAIVAANAYGQNVGGEERQNQKGIIERLATLEEKFEKSLIVTTERCDSFGEGWSSFDSVNGRVLLGSNASRGNGLSVRRVGDTGGAEVVSLSLDEMPEHAHDYRAMRGAPRDVDGVDSTTVNSGDNIVGDLETGPSGEGVPHQNMPPFFVVNICGMSSNS